MLHFIGVNGEFLGEGRYSSVQEAVRAARAMNLARNGSYIQWVIDWNSDHHAV